MMAAAIVNPESVAILKYTLVGAPISFPRRIRAKYDFAACWTMQFQSHSVESLDKMLIDEKFSTTANVDRIDRRRTGGGDRQNHSHPESGKC
jgi:hypothetical protein